MPPAKHSLSAPVVVSLKRCGRCAKTKMEWSRKMREERRNERVLREGLRDGLRDGMIEGWDYDVATNHVQWQMASSPCLIILVFQVRQVSRWWGGGREW